MKIVSVVSVVVSVIRWEVSVGDSVVVACVSVVISCSLFNQVGSPNLLCFFSPNFHDLLKNKAQIVHSHHRYVSNFIMNLISTLGAYHFFDNKPAALAGYTFENTRQLSLFLWTPFHLWKIYLLGHPTLRGWSKRLAPKWQCCYGCIFLIPYPELG